MQPPKARRELGTASKRARWMLPTGETWRLVYYSDGKAQWEAPSGTLAIAPDDPDHPSNEPTWREYVADAPRPSYSVAR